MKIRNFKPRDYKGFAKVLKSVGSLYYTESYKAIMRAYRHNPDMVLVAEDNGKIVGTVLGQGDGIVSFIWSLAVLPKEQGKGIGKKLVLEIEKRLRKMGCLGIELFTSPKRKKAVHMYKKLGYRLVKKAYVMAKHKF